MILERYARARRIVDRLSCSAVDATAIRSRRPAGADRDRSWSLGAACLISSALLSEEPSRLASLEPELVELLLMPYLGRSEARRIAR